MFQGSKYVSATDAIAILMGNLDISTRHVLEYTLFL